MMFLGRAVDQLGRALLAEAWTGEESTAELMQPIGLATDARTINNIIARHLPQFERKEYRGSMAPPPLGEPSWSPPKFDISIDERKVASGFVNQQNAKAESAIDRFTSVQNAIVEHAIAGKLATAYRAMVGGEFYPIPAIWWNTERLKPRFTFCRINPDDPFGANGKAWIFVSRVDLERMLQHLSPTATSNDERKCANWLEEQFLQDPDVRISKAKFQDRAKELFGTGPKPFGRVWDELAKKHPERKVAGPKRKG